MAAYAAVISLLKTFERILHSSRTSFVYLSRGMIMITHKKLLPFREILKRLDSISLSKSRKRVNALDGRIKEAVWRFEDLLESHISQQILPQLEGPGGETRILLYTNDLVLLYSIDLLRLVHNFCAFHNLLEEMQKEYVYELDNMPRVEDDELVQSPTDFGGFNSESVGLSGYYSSARYHLTTEDYQNHGISLVGMAGTGKTTLAKKIFEQDAEVFRYFEHRAWVTVGRKSQFYETARAILAQLDPNIETVAKGDDIIGEKLRERLDDKKCLIILDDVWDKQVLFDLSNYFPVKNDGKIRILLTTRLRSIANCTSFPKLSFGYPLQMRLLREEQSKDLFRQKMFGEEDFPPQLEEAAEKIATNCEGLPLMIVMVADRLLKEENYEPEYWNAVANKRSSVFLYAYNEISKVLFPSYDCFLQHVKPLLLYVGAFPQDYKIPASKLLDLLSAESFTELQNLGLFAFISAEEFSWWNEILKVLHYTSTMLVKTLGVYSWWWHLFNKEAPKDKFFRVLNSGFQEGLEGQRRLVLHSNVVLNIKMVYNAVKRKCASTTRSLLCFGPYHQYSLPLDVGFKLLRVLDALKVRFYNFPIEVLELVFLQYLALTSNGELPTSISKLFNLQFLIIHPHMSIRSPGTPSYVPVQIWDMQELNHIEILGRSIPNPNSATCLQKLAVLLGVSANSCTKEVFEKIPNIKKLGIQIELMPYDDGSNPLSCFDHISQLENIRALKCRVVNPELRYGFVAQPTPLSMLPSTLQKLHLSGMGYPWKYMKVIGSLPNLEVLKLRFYAFRGPVWRTKGNSFLRVRFLLIEDTDLVQWKLGDGSFPGLITLRLKHCYKLKEIQWPCDAATFGGIIEIVDCNPLAFTCAKQFKPRTDLEPLHVTGSIDDVELK